MAAELSQNPAGDNCVLCCWTPANRTCQFPFTSVVAFQLQFRGMRQTGNNPFVSISSNLTDLLSSNHHRFDFVCLLSRTRIVGKRTAPTAFHFPFHSSVSSRLALAQQHSFFRSSSSKATSPVRQVRRQAQAITTTTSSIRRQPNSKPNNSGTGLSQP